MTIRTRLSLLTAGLIAALVVAIALNVVRAQKQAVEAQSRERLATLMDGVVRIAQEAAAGHDQLMLMSYLMFLQKERPELALAAITHEGHTARVGADKPGLIYLTRAAPHRSGGDTVEVKLGFLGDKIEAEVARALQPLIARTLSIAALFLVLGLVGAAYISRMVTGPLITLTEAVEEVGKGRFNVSVPLTGRDEVGTLARQFNTMTAYIRNLHEQREDVLHTMTHELNTPLSGLKSYIELWQDGKLPEEEGVRQEVAQTLMAAIQRMETSLNYALKVFKAPPEQGQGGPRELVWIDYVFGEVCALFAPVAAAKDIVVQPPPPGATGYLYAETELIRRIITNLISNALKYTPEGGQILLGLHDDEAEIKFWVSNTGQGIPPEDLPHLFTKFYRSAPSSEAARRIPGSGLGLHIAKKAVEALGGRITVENNPGVGSTFLVTIPKTQQRKAVAAL